GGCRQSFADGLALKFIREPERWTMARVVGLSAMAGGFATTTDHSSDRSRAQVAQLRELRDQQRTSLFQFREGLRHGSSFCTYYIRSERRGQKRKSSKSQLSCRTPIRDTSQVPERLPCYTEASRLREPLLAPLAAIAAGIVVSRFVPFESRELIPPIAAFLILGLFSLWRESLAIVCAMLALTLAGALTDLVHRPGPPPYIEANSRT